MIPADSDLSPMQDPIWSLSCAETLTDWDSLAVVAIEDDDELLALAPLARQSGLLKGYEQLGVRALSEPSDFFYTNEPALDALIEMMSRSKKLLTFGRMPSDSKSVSALRRAFARRGIILTSHRSSYPYIALASVVGDVDELLSSHLRSDLRRAHRRASSMGTVSFEIHAPHSEREFLPLYEQVLKVEAANWKGRSGSALAVDAVRQNFFRVYGVRAANKGILRIALLRIGPDVVAVQYAVQSGNRFWLLKIGYDESYGRCSPGMLLMQETLRYAAEQGLRSYEFLGYTAPWTERWTSLRRRTIRIDACRLRPKCILALMNIARHLVALRLYRYLRRVRLLQP